MSRKIFVNLPVTDLDRAKGFYEGLGFQINPQFTDETAACVVISDRIYLMILTREKFGSFTALPVGEPAGAVAVMTALSCDSRDEVDGMAARAVAHGGGQPRPATDYGFMYSRMLTDPDGNVFEPFWIDMAGFEAARRGSAQG